MIENNFGPIGGSFNTVNNYWIQQVLPPLLNNTGPGNAGIPAGQYKILWLEMLNKYIEYVKVQIEKDLRDGRDPIKVRITQMVDDCAQGVYLNGGNKEDTVWELVGSIFSVVCLCCGWDFDADCKKIGSQYYYEFSQPRR